ncbi:hypothetical protein QZN29_25410 [Burkholderia multivorans]|uniref:hypothetical protein n=1 Tax=Burkholderia multivorans TaxID=87883 RepID=UPI0021BFBDC4|nr:hypothetical protein [Burkholderia multivorans]MDN8092987.1 hypothetical protein [Burkholderia multivorans]MDN8098488.1 hypothetical protein [Burkholderia multivorans]MDN8109583.1 hypothetical protein [Burkholderia multivorans]MDN8129475.1 hypothetical protein [Burkholderia multivorans]MDN8135122.1 hypothetical protein [Burkholderia multivorans]
MACSKDIHFKLYILHAKMQGSSPLPPGFQPTAGTGAGARVANHLPESNPTLFDVLQEHGIAQPTADNKAIWKAAVASSNGWTQSFTFLKLAPGSIWDADSQPSPFTGTVRVAQDASIVSDAAVTTPLPPAAPFTGNTSSSPTTTLPASPAPSRASDTIDALLDLLGGPVPAPIRRWPRPAM